MKVTVDTNVLIRAAVQDDKAQASLAIKVLKEADLIAIPLPVLCEFVWVLSSAYKKSTPDISDAIYRLINCSNVAINRPAVEAGLSMLNSGGDFADGIIAYEGTWLGGDELISFDKKAVTLLKSQGVSARLL
jgi:predicted nucleic-acid-binding protein